MSRRALSGAILITAVLGTACAKDGGRSSEGAPSPEASPATSADPLGALVDAQQRAARAGAPPPRRAPSPLRVLVAGDLIPHRPSLATASAVGGALAPLGPLFGGANAVVANYEAATSSEGVLPRGKMDYAAPRDWLAELRRAGLSAVTVANNHACDLEAEGVSATLDAAHTAGITAIGGDREDPWAPRVLAESEGKRVCAVAWTTQMNSEGACAHGKQLAILSPGKRARVTQAIARARSTCDAVVAIVHGGNEYAPQTERMTELAHHVAEVGADAVVLHHPHVTSPVELVTTKDGRKVPVFASVGNLVSNQGESWTTSMFPVQTANRRLVCVNAWTRLGMIADLAFHFEPEGLRTEWGYHLVWTDNEHAADHKVLVPKIEARLLDPERDRGLVAKLSEDHKGPVPVFEDPCWVESPGSEDARAHRCSVQGGKGPASPAAFATAPAAPKGPAAPPGKAPIARAGAARTRR